jgi:hypothetical protein
VSLEARTIFKELSGFFVRVTTMARGVGPDDLKLAFFVFGQKLGVTKQTGIVNVLESVMK